MIKIKPIVLKKENFFKDGENVHIQKSSNHPDYIGIVHSHEYIEVIYVLSGRAIHEIDGKKYNVKRGDLFIVNINTPHVFYIDKTFEEPFVAYDLMFTPEFFDSAMGGYHPLEALNNSFMFHSLFSERQDFPPFFSITGSQYNAFGELFNKIYLEQKTCKKGWREIIRAYLLELIITIYRLDEEKVKSVGNNEIRTRQIINFITDYINENYYQKLSVSELAKTVYLNPDYLGRIFKKQTGLSISETIQKVRIERACNLLATTDKTISNIAFLCGFEDMKFFYNVFKKRMGILPSKYRKNIKLK